jgi:hypothetical protein
MVVKHLFLLQTEKESVTKRKQKDIKSRTSFYELTPWIIFFFYKQKKKVSQKENRKIQNQEQVFINKHHQSSFSSTNRKRKCHKNKTKRYNIKNKFLWTNTKKESKKRRKKWEKCKNAPLASCLSFLLSPLLSSSPSLSLFTMIKFKFSVGCWSLLVCVLLLCLLCPSVVFVVP